MTKLARIWEYDQKTTEWVWNTLTCAFLENQHKNNSWKLIVNSMCLSDRSGSYRPGGNINSLPLYSCLKHNTNLLLPDWSGAWSYTIKPFIVTSPENLEDFCYRLTRKINLCRLNLYYSDRNIVNMANLFPTNLESSYWRSHSCVFHMIYLCFFSFLSVFFFFLLAQKRKQCCFTTQEKKKNNTAVMLPGGSHAKQWHATFLALYFQYISLSDYMIELAN